MGEEIPNGVAGRNGRFGLTANVAQSFTGQEADGGTAGLDYFNARHLSTVTGRFLQVDPANAGADLMNPQSWNGYAYVWGDPLGNVDPSGMFAEADKGLDYGSWGWWAYVELTSLKSQIYDIGAIFRTTVTNSVGTSSVPTASAQTTNTLTPPKTGTDTPNACNGGPVTAYSANATYSLSGAGAAVGSLAGPSGTLIGYASEACSAQA